MAAAEALKVELASNQTKAEACEARVAELEAALSEARRRASCEAEAHAQVFRR